MNENIDLTKILEGCEGMSFYYSPLGINMKLESLKTKLNSFPIMFNSPKLDYPILLTREGRIENNKEFPDAECVIFPSKEQRDWTKFQRPIPVDTPMMCSKFGDYVWILCYYSMFYNGKHRCFYKGCTSKNADANNKTDSEWSYMIPFDKFNPNDIEESLKYNIQK